MKKHILVAFIIIISFLRASENAMTHAKIFKDMFLICDRVLIYSDNTKIADGANRDIVTGLIFDHLDVITLESPSDSVPSALWPEFTVTLQKK